MLVLSNPAAHSRISTSSCKVLLPPSTQRPCHPHCGDARSIIHAEGVVVCYQRSDFWIEGDSLTTSSKSRLSARRPHDSIWFGCLAFLLCIPQQFDLSSRHVRLQPVVAI
jgi:hypothetical protein